MQTIDNLKKYASKLMFDMKDKEYETLLAEFEVLEKKFDKIESIDGIKDVIPMVLPFEIEGVTLRDDEVMETISTEEALSNAKNIKGDEVMVPKVVEE